jgi:hypothetical protein
VEIVSGSLFLYIFHNGTYRHTLIVILFEEDVGNVACMVQMRNAFRIMIGKR